MHILSREVCGVRILCTHTHMYILYIGKPPVCVFSTGVQYKRTAAIYIIVFTRTIS